MRILSIVVCAFFITGCFTTDVIYGTGSVTTVADTLARFNGELTVDFPANIVLTSGDPLVTFTTDNNIQKYFSIDTSGGNLAIHRDSKYSYMTTEQTIHVSLPFVHTIKLTDAIVNDTVHADSIRSITLWGKSKFSGKITCEKLNLSTNGNSELDLIGEVDFLTCTHRSSSFVDLSKMLTFDATVDNMSSSSVRLNVATMLSGTIASSGNIELTTTNPIVAVKTIGTGSVVYLPQ